MDVFQLRDRLVSDYQTYTQSFLQIAEPRTRQFVAQRLADGLFWPQPLLQLNPAYAAGGTIDELVDRGLLHDECRRIFRVEKGSSDLYGQQLRLHRHQREAIELAAQRRSFVLTSGTGSGKSLSYIVPIVDHVLRRGSGNGIQAIVVYPMNALANSQDEELRKFLEAGYPPGGSPLRFARYTGQERGEQREALRSHPPDVLLTNYVMLELLLTRVEDRALIAAAQGLSFLVFDELHTYRGRQGADVALLIRRVRQALNATQLRCIGTSATMVSGEDAGSRTAAVARVATTLFGEPFGDDQVLEETLERATDEPDFGAAAVVRGLRAALSEAAEPPQTAAEFLCDPLAGWIESTFGVRRESPGGPLRRQIPRRVDGPPLEGRLSAAAELAALTDVPAVQCAAALRRMLLRGAALHRRPGDRYPIFAFRLHQFFSRGDSVWAGLRSEAERYLSIEKLGAVPGAPDEPLYPLLFCRSCGAGYFRVSVDQQANRLLPFEGRSATRDDRRAYLYISDSAPWPRNPAEQIERLPAALKVDGKVDANWRKRLPQAVSVAPDGSLVRAGQGQSAALLPDAFHFCLNPACGVVHRVTQRAETAKLAGLGIDSRSTATTILAVRALLELRRDEELPAVARKLLSFTDNRQDASLQAGHFNDFSQVALLRSGLYRALAEHPQGLTHEQLPAAVVKAIGLQFADYAADPDLRGPARSDSELALRRVVEYFLYRDLQRGWRVTAPNLEECGLLRFAYLGLEGDDGLLADGEIWTQGALQRDAQGNRTRLAPPPALQALSTDLRRELLLVLLDQLRRNLALKADVLTAARQPELIELSHQRLQQGTVWYLEQSDDLVQAQIAVVGSAANGGKELLPISAPSGYGQYLKRRLRESGQPLTGDEIEAIIGFLFAALRQYGLVEQLPLSRGKSAKPGYQLVAAALRWLPAAAERAPQDVMRRVSEGDTARPLNRYFIEYYRTFAELHLLLEAREHTAQVTAADRAEREERFRRAELPLLFCSPTMELGVDIAQLNLVNLRNVPPTPANYAQRSGRAGRGGQPALVYTYASAGSPHDQYFFREPSRMVAGAVAPPRIDLANRDLLRAHLHALWLGTAGINLGATLSELIVLDHADDRLPLPIKRELAAVLRDANVRRTAEQQGLALAAALRAQIDGLSWLTDDWVREVFGQLEQSFELACTRWRSLYRAAVRQRELHHRILGDHSRPEFERAQSRRLRSQAETQIRLLTEAEGAFEGDFYSYRYLAAEGFLPGYSFPRLPISAFIPARRNGGRDEFVSRPRFLAIREFGPRALVYHEGSRYAVHRVNLDFGSSAAEAGHELPTRSVKRCAACGYAHFESGRANLADICERCGGALDGPALIRGLVEMQNVSLRPEQRITSDEEERRRQGYRIVSSYRFERAALRLDAQVQAQDGTPLIELQYADNTELYRINLGWARGEAAAQPGFLLDLERGTWARRQDEGDELEDAQSGARMQLVVPFVRDSKNALIVRPHNTTPEINAGLQSALLRALQHVFQLESNELAADALPTPVDRREILIYEAAEGGAGVLRRLVQEPALLPRLARTALALLHYDADGTDLAADSCGRACYRCLLDYSNQPDHHLLDRALLREPLQQLAAAQVVTAGGAGTRAERLAELLARCESSLERHWLQTVARMGLALPELAQQTLPNAYARPDFSYPRHNTLIFVDGPVHDRPGVHESDAALDAALGDLGYYVLRFRHDEEWPAVFAQNREIFGGGDS
jgi:superfamily II DNA or RNA helicase/very-short-patch-repair endonuclease